MLVYFIGLASILCLGTLVGHLLGGRAWRRRLPAETAGAHQPRSTVWDGAAADAQVGARQRSAA
jgi:hypothetical protein